MINNQFIKSDDEKNLIYKTKLLDSKTCFYKCELRNIRLNIKENNLYEFDSCVNKCFELNKYKEKITDFYFRQSKEFVNNPYIHSLRKKIEENRKSSQEYAKLNDIYLFEDFRFSTTAEVKYEDMKKHEIGSLFGRNK